MKSWYQEFSGYQDFFSPQSSNKATTNHTHDYVTSNPKSIHMAWSGQQSQPNWLWGTYGDSKTYVFSPDKIKVGAAGTADKVDWLGIQNNQFSKCFGVGDHPHVRSGLNFYFDGTADLWLSPACYRDGGIATSYHTLGVCGATTYYNNGNNHVDASSSYPEMAGLVRRCRPSSSRRYKHDIVDIHENFDPSKVYDIPVVSFVFNDGYLMKEDERYNAPVPGFIAEELDKIFPIAVNHNSDGSVESWNADFFIPILTSVVQEQHKEIEELKKCISELKE